MAIIGKNGEWFDEACVSNPRTSICEDLDDELLFWNPCPEGWDLINRKCYRFINQMLKFDTAVELCKSLGGQLFEPTFELQEKMVREFYYDMYQQRAIWIGVTDRAKQGR